MTLILLYNNSIRVCEAQLGVSLTKKLPVGCSDLVLTRKHLTIFKLYSL